ncbi:MAG: phosphoribosylamine--glycine ligase [Treponema sp.]|jgi:phosphoribosylamine--glycine ligase|nr:phosphoribosylamine--glycine ligase [Treponema sp.]
MKILVIGSGCREHALAWKIAQSEKAEKIFIAPGNGGTAAEHKCENVSLNAHDPASAEGQQELLQFALKEKIGLAVVGPELPLAEGIVDKFRAAGLAIIGPDKKAAQLEASKMYSKAFMAKYGIRTAASSDFSDVDAALEYARRHFGAASAAAASAATSAPLVIKADGLAAGKGVVIAQNLSEAETALYAFMKDKSLGAAGASVVLEEFLEGKEVSILAAVSVVSGSGYILPFIAARDHKRRFDGGQGPNTGGMGAISPVPGFSEAARRDFVTSILEPTLNGMKAEVLDYRGFIFFGLMIKNEQCYLLEYNVRLGDPETQAVLPLMDFDLLDLCAAITGGSDFPLKWKAGAVCAPVAVAEGYPGSYRKGDAITINDAALEKTGAQIFFGGAVAEKNGASVPRTSGGRVLTVSAFGSNADEAWANAYQGLEAISFNGMGYRKDIGRE